MKSDKKKLHTIGNSGLGVDRALLMASVHEFPQLKRGISQSKQGH